MTKATTSNIDPGASGAIMYVLIDKLRTHFNLLLLLLRRHLHRASTLFNLLRHILAPVHLHIDEDSG